MICQAEVRIIQIVSSMLCGALSLTGCTESLERNDAGRDSSPGSVPDASGKPYEAGPDRELATDGSPGDEQEADASTALGTDECPTVSGECPPECLELFGSRYNPEKNCTESSEFLVCTTQQFLPATPGCTARIATGDVYFLGRGLISEPYFSGWRFCAADEKKNAFDAPSCQ